LLLLTRLELDSGKLSDTLYDIGDTGTKNALNILTSNIAVFDRIVKERRDERRLVELEPTYQERRLLNVRKIRLARSTNLPSVTLLREVVRFF
jgi:hypothetical protein